MTTITSTSLNAYANDTTMTLEADERTPVLSYAPPDADALFPMPDVSSHALASWKASPMTHAVIALIHRMRHAELSAGYRGNEEQFLLRKGRVEAFDRLVGEIDQLEAEILHASSTPVLDYDAGANDSDDDNGAGYAELGEPDDEE